MAALAADAELGEVELPERVAVRRLEPPWVLVADRSPLVMHRRVPGLAQHAGDRLHRHPPAKEPLELGANLRRPHRRVLLLVVEDRLDLVLAEPRARIVRRARRERLHRGRLRRGRLRHSRRVLPLAGLGHQPLLLAPHVPPPQRLRRTADLLRDLLALHPGEDQRQRTRMLRGRVPPPTRGNASSLAAARTGLRDTVTFTRRMRSDHERLLTGIAGPGARLYAAPGLGQRLADLSARKAARRVALRQVRLVAPWRVSSS